MAARKGRYGLGERLGNAAYHILSGKALPSLPTKFSLATADLTKIGRVPKNLQNPPKGWSKAGLDINDPYRDPTLDEIAPRPQGRPGKVFQRWTYPFRGYSMPILEIPSNRVQRYLAMFEYYTTEDLVNASLNMKVEFALANHEVHVTIDSDTIPIWMPLDEIPDQSTIPEEARTPNRVYVAQYIKRKLEDLKEKLDLDRWNQNQWLEAGIYGDGFANIVDGIEDEAESGMEEEAPALQTLAAKAGKGDKKAQAAYYKARTALANQKTKIAKERMARAEITRILSAMEEIEAGYKETYKKTFAAGKLLMDKADKEAKKGEEQIEVGAGAVRIHVGPKLLDKAEKLTENFGQTAEEAFVKLNALAKERDKLLIANAQALGGNYTIDVLQTLNPSAVWETRNDVGEVVRMELVKRIGVDASPLVVDDQIHIRWSGSDYTTYGISDIFPAFRAIKLKRNLEEALAAYAERYSQPIIVCKVGESENEQMYAALEILMSDAENLFRNYDRRSVLVVPWHYDINIVGTEGKPLRLDMYLQYAVERMLTALGVPKTFLWGDGSNYATARTQFQSLITRLKSLQFKSNRMLASRVYGRFLERRGYKDGDGGRIKVECRFENNDLDSEEIVAKLLSAMAQVSAATGNPLLLSETTLLEMLGQDIDIEHQNKLREAAKLMKLKSIAPEQAPAQDPAKMPPDPNPVVPFPNPLSMAAASNDAMAALANLTSALDKEMSLRDLNLRRQGKQAISMKEAAARLKAAQEKLRGQLNKAEEAPAAPIQGEPVDPLKLDDRVAPDNAEPVVNPDPDYEETVTPNPGKRQPPLQ